MGTAILAVLFAFSDLPAERANGRGLVVSPPEFTESGQVVVIARRGEDKFTLERFDPYSGAAESQDLELGPLAGLPRLKKDVRGGLWVAWTEESGLANRVVVGRIREGLVSSRRIEAEIGGAQPWDLCFDPHDRIWLAWVDDAGAGQMLRVRRSDQEPSWNVSSPCLEVCAPRLLCDAGGAVWAFWTAVVAGREQVFSSRFDGSVWSGEIQLSPGTGRPNITPSGVAGRDGRIWLVWSGYDGIDYEIMMRVWDGAEWSTAGFVSENVGANDVFPWVGLAYEALPVISWVRFAENGRSEAVRCGPPEALSDEVVTPAEGSGQLVVPLAVRGDLAVRAGEKRGTIDWQRFFLPRARSGDPAENRPLSPPHGSSPRALPVLPELIYNPDLKENAYLAFGDSITYGVCDEDRIDDPGDYIPEKAYPPRLEALLSKSFGPHQVVNAGVPGESTFQGLARLDSLMSEHLARYLLILEGTNDIIWDDYSLETTSFNLGEMIRRGMEFGLLPALATCIPRFGSNPNPNRLRNLNTRIRQLAADCRIPLVDLNQDFSDYPPEDGGTESLYCWGEDRTHPNEKGYQFMAEKWFQRIINFPFPPGDSSLRRVTDEILFFSRQGNLLEWRDNPKISDPGRIQEVRIYRKLGSEPSSAFRLLAAVSGRRDYFDTDILPEAAYDYVLATVISLDIQGPCTPPLSR